MSGANFAVDVPNLRRREKGPAERSEAAADEAGQRAGFSGPGRGRPRPKSPRTGQVHTRVLPEVADAISAEAARRSVTIGVVIEEAFELYLQDRRLRKDGSAE